MELSDLGKIMDETAEALEADVNDFVGDVVYAVQREVVRETPVDVGTARSNWVVRLGAPWTLVYRAYAPHPSRYAPPYPRPGTTKEETANLYAAQRQAAGVLGRRKADETVYITNNLHYIGKLAAGYSSQSPSGYVEGAINSGVNQAIRKFRFNRVGRIK